MQYTGNLRAVTISFIGQPYFSLFPARDDSVCFYLVVEMCSYDGSKQSAQEQAKRVVVAMCHGLLEGTINSIYIISRNSQIPLL